MRPSRLVVVPSLSSRRPRQHDVVHPDRRVHERGDRDHLDASCASAPASGPDRATRPPGRRRQHQHLHGAGLDRSAAPRRRRRRARRARRRARSAPVGRGSTPPRSCSPRACAAAAMAAVSTGSVTISTGHAAVASWTRVADELGQGVRASSAPAVWRTVPASRSSSDPPGPTTITWAAAAAGLADAQVEHAAAIGHVAVADDRDHVGAVEVVDACDVRIEQLPRTVAPPPARRRSGRGRRARCGPRRRPPRW